MNQIPESLKAALAAQSDDNYTNATGGDRAINIQWVNAEPALHKGTSIANGGFFVKADANSPVIGQVERIYHADASGRPNGTYTEAFATSALDFIPLIRSSSYNRITLVEGDDIVIADFTTGADKRIEGGLLLDTTNRVQDTATRKAKRKVVVAPGIVYGSKSENGRNFIGGVSRSAVRWYGYCPADPRQLCSIEFSSFLSAPMDKMFGELALNIERRLSKILSKEWGIPDLKLMTYNFVVRLAAGETEGKTTQVYLDYEGRDQFDWLRDNMVENGEDIQFFRSQYPIVKAEIEDPNGWFGPAIKARQAWMESKDQKAIPAPAPATAKSPPPAQPVQSEMSLEPGDPGLFYAAPKGDSFAAWASNPKHMAAFRAVLAEKSIGDQEILTKLRVKDFGECKKPVSVVNGFLLQIEMQRQSA